MQGIVLAGSADFKTELGTSDLLDNRLKDKVIKTVDVSYGGENGFNQAIGELAQSIILQSETLISNTELAADALSNVKFVQEKKLLENYYLQISLSTGKVTYGLQETLQALDAGAVESLIVFENLDTIRYTLQPSDPSKHSVVVCIGKEEAARNREQFLDKENGREMEILEQIPFIEWLVEAYQQFGATL